MSSDPGLQLVSALQSELQIEPEWLVPVDRGFQWWPGHLSQRVWADPFTEIGSHKFSRVHIESDFLRSVDESEKVLTLTAYANRLTTISAVVFNPEEKRIRLHTSVCVSEENVQAVLKLAVTIAQLQAADASAKSLGFADTLSVEPDVTAHPATGTRNFGSHVSSRTSSDGGAESRVGFRIGNRLQAARRPRPTSLGHGIRREGRTHRRISVHEQHPVCARCRSR